MNNISRTYWLSKRFKQSLARNRKRPLVKRIARYAQEIIKGYENSNYDFNTNGERFLLETAEQHINVETIFDVGANIGKWSLMAVDCCPNAVIHSFEIVALTYEKLYDRLKHNNKIILNNCGLDSANREVLVNYCPDNDALSSMVEYPHGLSKNIIRAYCQRGDEYVRQNNIKMIDVLKIDVEGGEFNVLKGFENSLNQKIIRVIQFEHGRANLVTRIFLSDYYQFFNNYGFVVGKLYPNYVAFKEYELCDEDFIGPNYIAIHKSETQLIKSLSG